MIRFRGRAPFSTRPACDARRAEGPQLRSQLRRSQPITGPWRALCPPRRKHPELRNKVFISAVFVGLAHGTFLIMRASEEEANLTKRETARAEAAKAAAKAAVPRE